MMLGIIRHGQGMVMELLGKMNVDIPLLKQTLESAARQKSGNVLQQLQVLVT